MLLLLLVLLVVMVVVVAVMVVVVIAFTLLWLRSSHKRSMEGSAEMLTLLCRSRKSSLPGLTLAPFVGL